jgi:hypothetical protein
MRTFFCCLFAALMLVAAPTFAQSDIVKRPVQFAKGKSGATIKGSVTGDETVDYTLRAAAGQTMTVKLSSASAVYHNVLPPGSTGEALFVGSRDGSRSTTTLPASGDYTIRLYQMGHASSSGKRSNFTLDVAIAGGAQQPVAASTSSDDDKMVEASTRASASSSSSRARRSAPTSARPAAT